MFVDRWWGNQYDAWIMCSYLWVSDDFFEVVLVLFKRNVLLVRSVCKRCIIGAEENSLLCLMVLRLGVGSGIPGSESLHRLEKARYAVILEELGECCTR